MRRSSPGGKQLQHEHRGGISPGLEIKGTDPSRPSPASKSGPWSLTPAAQGAQLPNKTPSSLGASSSLPEFHLPQGSLCPGPHHPESPAPSPPHGILELQPPTQRAPQAVGRALHPSCTPCLGPPKLRAWASRAIPESQIPHPHAPHGLPHPLLPTPPRGLTSPLSQHPLPQQDCWQKPYT